MRVTTRLRRARRCAAFMTAAVLLAGFASACGNDTKPSASDGAAPSAGASGSTGGDIVAQAQQHVDGYMKDVTFVPLQPAPAAAGKKKIFIISPSQALAGDVRTVGAAEDAVKQLGWDAVIIDGRSDPTVMAAGIQRAVSEKADGILLPYVNTNLVNAAAAAARAAGIPLVSLGSANEVGPNGVSWEVGTEQPPVQGEMAAWYTIAKADGKAKVLYLNDTSFPTLKANVTKAQSILDGCKDCSMTTLDFTSSQVGPTLTGLVDTALRRNPDVNWIVAPYGAAAVFSAQAVRQSGRDIKMVGNSSDLANYNLIRTGDVQVAAIDNPLEYCGYLMVYEMNLVLSGKQPVRIDIPYKILDKSNLPPEGQPWTGDQDYVAQFKAAWGV